MMVLPRPPRLQPRRQTCLSRNLHPPREQARQIHTLYPLKVHLHPPYYRIRRPPRRRR